MVDEAAVAGREAMANTAFAKAQASALESLGKLADYTNSKLNVVLFSGEGDSLHQIFDCIMQVRLRPRLGVAMPDISLIQSFSQ
jgi:hypothetical protein